MTTDVRLKAIVHRVEELTEHRRDIATQVRDIYVEAKLNGYDPKAIKEVIRLRKEGEDEGLDNTVEMYLEAIK